MGKLQARRKTAMMKKQSMDALAGGYDMAEDINKQRLANYLEAEKKAMEGQEYQDGSIKVRRADLDKLGSGINTLLATGAGATVTGTSQGRCRRVIFVDE